MRLAGNNQDKKHFIIYTIIIVVIGLLSFNIYFILEEALNEQKESAYIINLSGRQRMLSQLIIVNALSYEQSPSEKNATALEKSIVDMRVSHQFLINQPSLPTSIRRLYFQPTNLDAQVSRYLSLAEIKLTNSENIAALNTLKLMSINILADLDKVVYENQKQSQQNVEKQHILQLSMLLLIFSLLVVKGFWVILPIYKKLQLYLHLAVRDSLTGLYNRRHFFQALEEEHNRSLRYNTTYSLCIIDIDNFKLINDQYGHPAGDQVLKQVAQTIAEEIRINDQCARIGGEEFSVLLIDTNEEQAFIAAEKIRKKIHSMRPLRNQPNINITASIGFSTYSSSPNQTRPTTTKEIVKRADSALYIAKKSGRNRTKKWDAELDNKSTGRKSPLTI